MSLQSQNFMHEEEETDTGTPKRYLPLQDVYSATVPCVSASGSSNVMSKKVKARKIVEAFDDPPDEESKKRKKKQQEQSSLQVYTRRGSGSSSSSLRKPSFFESLLRRVEAESNSTGNLEEGIDAVENKGRICENDKVLRNCEILKLGFEGFAGFLNYPRLRENRVRNLSGGGSVKERKRKLSSIDCQENGSSGLTKRKRWVQVSFEDVDPCKFIGLVCKVYWPLDDAWYQGRVTAYNSEKREHQVKYEDGDEENLIFVNEKIKFQISHEQMQQLNLKCIVTGVEERILNYCEMAVLAAGFDDSQELEPGDIIWAKLAGHAMWPAVIVNESICRGLKPSNGEKSVSVQFFGTHDFARIKTKQVIPFLKGLFAFFHLKCKRSSFHRGLEEAKVYLSEQKLPAKMLQMQRGTGAGDFESSSEEDEENVGSIEDEAPYRTLEPVQSCPFEIGDLCILSLGKIVKDSEYFHNKQYNWPEGYVAVRKYISVLDPGTYGSYRMEVVRDPRSKFKPLFRVIMDEKEKFKGSTPSVCWKKIYERIRKMHENMSRGCNTEGGVEIIEKSGSYMFGFSNRKVHKLIQELSYSSMPSMYSACKMASKRYRDVPVGYRPVRVEWKDLDKCNVCHMDEEYENNLFLQCDKCRMMVHARCYGELEPTDGVLWLCNLCRLGVKCPPPCCLCPVIGGAMKRTTDGRWAHLACAIWIPETCLSDIKKMEPIDGLNRINKDRWKLLCSICGVAYGACIQCSNNTCRVAYHPLCARAAGLCIELEDEDKLHLMSFDEDDDDQCIRLLSYCKKHRQPLNERSPSDEQTGPFTRQCSNHAPPLNPSGCARAEPYDFLGRRGRKEPEALAAASLKRLYVENRPYLVTGYCQSGTAKGASVFNELLLLRYPSERQKLRTCQPETPPAVVTMAEKYKHMRETFRKRLAFGKSGIHGFGIFAKHPHRAGDMVIEYTGEVVRPSVADRREHLIYNSLVGAGTYMFRVDDERVVDATRAGSIAHLINHSCEPNCYSRVISVHGDEHIIIFAKRDIEQWEELTYDYRFFSIDEQLACYCGFPRCRGVVNDIDAEEQAAKLYVPRSKLIDWKEE